MRRIQLRVPEHPNFDTRSLKSIRIQSRKTRKHSIGNRMRTTLGMKKTLLLGPYIEISEVNCAENIFSNGRATNGMKIRDDYTPKIPSSDAMIRAAFSPIVRAVEYVF